MCLTFFLELSRLTLGEVQQAIQINFTISGKTLAFVLPIVETLTNGQTKASRKTGYGRPPSVLVLVPTRQLANQVHADFEVYGGALGLSASSLSLSRARTKKRG